MLRELVELGNCFALPPSGYSFVVVHWQIDVSLKSVIPLFPDKPGKKLELGKKLLLPDLRRNADESLLIDDGGEYVFGVGPRGAKRQKLYLNLLDTCIAETSDSWATMVRDYVQSCDVEALDRKLSELIPSSKKRDCTTEQREQFWWARDRFVFTCDGERVTERPVIQQWWSNYYASKQDVEDGTCILTGDQTLIVRQKMPMMVKGVPNTQSSGAALTSFDKPAYQSHGWDGTKNATIGYDSSVIAHQALDVLLRDDNHHYRLGGSVFVFWGNQDGEGLDPEFWSDPASVAAKAIFITPKLPSKLPGGRKFKREFYLAILKGNKGRIALSSWSSRDREEIKTNIKRFVESQQCALGLKARPVWALRNCAFRDPAKEHTDKIATALIYAVLFGAALPDNYSLLICDRICAEQDVLKSYDRVQALAFYLVSNDSTIMEKLSNLPTEERLNSEQVAFILGRIAFLMHMAQVRAQNLSREETNVSRSLRTLSTNPALMFPRLYYGCIAHHLVDRDAKNSVPSTKPSQVDNQETKTKQKDSNPLGYIKHSLDEEFRKFGANFNPAFDLPKYFDAKAQSCFFLGWGIRRAEFFQKKDKQENQEG